MDPQEPVIPDPDGPGQSPNAPVDDPTAPDRPSEYQAGSGGNGDYEEGLAEYAAIKREEDLDSYDEAVDESFPASDPPAASQPGRP
ncbi:MAG TPA: hypothetical protein VE826_02550 [Dongiaceae bacterium]|nr:hypothetical protein [Dongiaceae bacterium]